MANVGIKKRGKVYQYQFEIASVKGKRKWITKSGFKTKAEAEKEGNKAYTEYLNAGIPFKENNISYSDYLDYWVTNYCRTNLKYNTIQAYINIIKNHIEPKLGKYRLSTITSVKLNTYITELCEENDFAFTYFKNILKVLKGSFRDACDKFGFIKYNPARDLRLPRLEKKKTDIKHLYTQEEIDLILERLSNNDTFTCAFLTSCYTGMRTGEVCALTWDNIDLENGIINVEHNVYDKPKDEKGRWYIGSTKTENGIRKIHIGQTLKLALQNYKQKQLYLRKIYGIKYNYYHIEDVLNEYGKVIEHRIVKNYNNEDKLDLVFTREDGTYLGTDITKYPFKIIHNELGIEKCRFYDLRGSYATKILNKGIEIRDVADILGHKNIETTENFYISSTDDTRKYATEVFDNAIKSETINKIIKYGEKV